MTYMKAALRCLALAVLMLTLGGAAFSEQGKKNEPQDRTVQGVVLDSEGKPAAGAIVQLKNMKTAQIRSFIALDKGEYFFGGLSPDVDYEIRAELGDKSSQTRTLSNYVERKTLIVTLKLSKPI